MAVKIINFKYVHMFGRAVASATLSVDGNEANNNQVLFSGTLLAALKLAQENQWELTNAQEVLNRLVVTDGYAS